MRLAVALEGTLRDMSLEDLFEIFEAGRRSGRLTLTRNDDHCRILIAQGQLAEAVLLQGPLRQPVAADTEAVLLVCTWDDAAFAFEHDAQLAARPRRITGTFAALQEQALRQSAASSAPLAFTDTVELSLGATAGGPTISLDLAEWQLVRAFSRQLSLAAACQAAGIAPADGLRAAQSLRQRGLLRRPEAAAAEAQSVAPAVAALPPTRPTSPPEPNPRAAPATRSLLKAIIRRMESL